MIAKSEPHIRLPYPMLRIRDSLNCDGVIPVPLEACSKICIKCEYFKPFTHYQMGITRIMLAYGRVTHGHLEPG